MSLYELREKYGIRLKKGLGQNLLLDDNINRIMVEAATLGPENDVVEVGAGLGALTDRIAGHAGRMLAVEIDSSFMPCLEDRFGENPNVRLFRGDILNHRPADLVKEFIPGGTAYKMISNLPYYITTPILFHFWESSLFFERMVIMVQEEVALRLTAPVGGSEYGRLTLAAEFYSEVDIVHKVPRTCFKPQPKVDSCIVRMRNRRNPEYPLQDRAMMLTLMRMAFSQRRKTLRNSLARSEGVGVPGEVILDAMAAANIDPQRRPQTLPLSDFGALALEINARLSP